MSTLKEHIYAVKNIINKGPASDDSRFSNRLIAHFLKQARVLLIKQKLDKYHGLSDQTYQTICVDLSLSTFHECGCIPYKVPCLVLKSNCTLPKEVVCRWGTSLKVMKADGTVIPKVSNTRQMLRQFALNGPVMGWLINNGKLFIIGGTNTRLKKVLISAIWEDPETLASCEVCDNNGNPVTPSCEDPENITFPIDSDIVFAMYGLTIQMLDTGLQHPEDVQNNASDVPSTSISS